MPKTSSSIDTAVFTEQLATYKLAIDDDIAAYSQQQKQDVGKGFGDMARLEVDAYLGILGRGGKRIRGALAMVGYEMCGGTDKTAALQLARAIEMLHAYILIVDDVQDQSDVRRGGPTAHMQLADYHKKSGLKGESKHFGVAIALNAALWGAHQAQLVLSGMNIDPEIRLALLDMANQTMATTAHGQTIDIVNEVSLDVANSDIEQVLEWKTAQYTFINPLSMGMTLAGANEQIIAAVADYGMHAGKAFQITDDILGTFGTASDTGKNSMDDIREGKHTSLIAYALEHANPDDKIFIRTALGNAQITADDFSRCKQIIVDAGAMAYAQQSAAEHVRQATAALEAQSLARQLSGTDFLRELANSLVGRTN